MQKNARLNTAEVLVKFVDLYKAMRTIKSLTASKKKYPPSTNNHDRTGVEHFLPSLSLEIGIAMQTAKHAKQNTDYLINLFLVSSF